MDFAVRIKDATEAVQQVPPLVDAISTLLQTSSGWVVLLILVFWILLNKNFFHFFAAIERRKRRRLEHIESYVANSSMADIDSVAVFRDIRDAYYFKHATGIYAEKRLRSSLIDLHEQLSPSLGWAHIQRAFSYLEIDSAGKFAVRVQSRFEKVGYWYNEVMGYMSILTSALIITILIFSDKTWRNILFASVEILAILTLAFFAFLQNRPEYVAKRIRKKIADFEIDKK